MYGNNKGTKIGSVTKSDGINGTVTFTTDYPYVGIRSNSGAAYLDEVEIIWN